MPYAYQSGDYYMQGDYYRGDPGLFGSIGRAIGGVVKTVAGVAARALPIAVPGIGGIVGGVAGSLLGGSRSTALVPASAGSLPPLQVPVTRTPGARGLIQRVLPGGATGYEVDLQGMLRKRRRMNVANPKALRRALRRVSGFGKLARRARRDIGRAASAVGVRRGIVRAKAGRR